MLGTVGILMRLGGEVACERSPAKWKNLRGQGCSHWTPDSHCCCSTFMYMETVHAQSS